MVQLEKPEFDATTSLANAGLAEFAKCLKSGQLSAANLVQSTQGGQIGAEKSASLQ